MLSASSHGWCWRADLLPDNVRLAIETVRPFGVDVSSGVEASKGIKDVEKMKSFIEGVKASDQ